MVPLPILFLMTAHLLQYQFLPTKAAITKYSDVDIPANGLPNPVQYFQHPSDEAETKPTQEENRKTLTAEDRTQQARFGFNHGSSSSYSGGGGIDGYSSSTSLYSPTRIDFGGLIVGAVVGLAALIIIPKIFHLFLYGTHYPNAFGSYGRSDLTNSTILSPEISNILTRLDDVISYNQMDSSSCLQRAVCSYIQSVNERVKTGDVTNMDAVLDSTFSNSIVSFLIDGSRFKSAVMIGKRGESCTDAYPKCTLLDDSISSGLKKILFG